MNILNRVSGSTLVITADQAKVNSKVTTSAEDAMWSFWVEQAHESAERETNLVFQLAECEQVFDGCDIDLHAPVRGIVSVKAVDDAGVETVLVYGTDYKYKRTSGFGLNVYLMSHPSHQAIIRYKAGFGAYTGESGEVVVTSGTVAPYKMVERLIFLLTNHYYLNRGVASDFNKYELPENFDKAVALVEKYL